MFNVRLAGDYLCGERLFTWLSLVIYLVVSCFVLFFFPFFSGTELGQFLTTFPTYSFIQKSEIS